MILKNKQKQRTTVVTNAIDKTISNCHFPLVEILVVAFSSEFLYNFPSMHPLVLSFSVTAPRPCSHQPKIITNQPVLLVVKAVRLGIKILEPEVLPQPFQQ